MTSNNIERMIMRAVANLPDNSPDNRQKVYEAAVRSMYNAMATRPQPERDQRLAALKQSIIQIEMRYQAGTPEVSLEQGEIDTGRPQTPATGELPPDRPGLQGLKSSLLEYVSPFQNRFANVGLYGLVFLVSAAAGYFFFQQAPAPRSTPDLEQSVPGEAASERQVASAPLAEEQGKEIFMARPENFFEGFRVLGKGDAYALKGEEPDKFIRFTGKANLIGQQFIPVTTTRIYSMTIEFRGVEGAAIDEAIMHVGFATYDADKKVETEAPGRHRYFVNTGRVGQKATPLPGGWFQLSGIITGIDAKPGAFRQTTVYARPVLLLNLGKTAVPLDVRSVKAIELQ